MNGEKFLYTATLGITIANLISLFKKQPPPELVYPSYEVSPEVVAMLEQRPEHVLSLPPAAETEETVKPKRGTGCIPCLPLGTLVSTNPGTNVIENIKQGDKVVDAFGNYTSVLDVSTRHFDSNLIRIHTPYQQPLLLTPEHPVLVVESHRCENHRKTPCLPNSSPKCSACTKRKYSVPKFIQASELGKTSRCHWIGYTALLPRLIQTNDLLELDVENISGVSLAKAKVWVKPVIKVDEDFMSLAGFYLSEGRAQKLVRGTNLYLYFGPDEVELANKSIELFCKVFGVQAMLRKMPTSLSVLVCSDAVGKLFTNLFGTGAKNKKVPFWLLTLPAAKQIALLKTYWQGDGYYRENFLRKGKSLNSIQLSADTVSPNLAYALRTILFRLGIIHSLRKVAVKDSYIGDRKIKGGPAFAISICGPSAITLCQMFGWQTTEWQYKQSHLAGIDEQWVYLPIRKVTHQQYNGPVFNLVTDSGTYTAQGIAVHNCSRDHMSTVSAALNESLRFAREHGLAHEEVQRRIAMAEDELNIAERIDLAPDKLTELPEQEREAARDTLARMRSLRQQLPELKTVEELENLASDATKLRLELRLRTLPKEIQAKLVETARQVENGNLSLEEGKEKIKMAFEE